VFGWFKKKAAPEVPSALRELVDRTLGPMALAVAVADLARDYTRDVQAGRVSYPAHKRKDASVVEVWADTRIEALRCIMGFVQADPIMLCDTREQARLLDKFLNDRPQFSFPQPSGDRYAQTIQAMWQVYVYLDKVGSVVADPDTDRDALKVAGKTILDTLLRRAGELREEWRAFELALQSGRSLPPRPETLFEAMYADVTAKTKTIALATRFGPDYHSNMKWLVNRVREKLQKERRPTAEIEAAAQEMQRTMDRTMAATDPDCSESVLT
jgi:hypothetical protein